MGLNLIEKMAGEPILIKTTLIVLAILVLSFLINFLLSHSILGMSYRIFVAPGVILHELSHAFLCLLTGASITKLSFFEKNGGHVEHRPPKIPIIGQVLISLAPFVVGAVVIYFLSKLLGLSNINIVSGEISRSNFINFLSYTFQNVNFHSVKNIVIIYLVLSIAVTMTPSGQDLRNTLSSLVFIGLVIYLVDRFTNFSFMIISIPTEVIMLLSTVIFLLIFSALLSIVFYIVSKFIKPI